MPNRSRRGPVAALVALTASLVPLCLSTGRAVEAAGHCGGAPSYVVAAGDSWYGIAARAEVAPAELFAANTADADTALHPGQSVCLPSGAARLCSGSTYTVGAGDGWFAIADRLGVAPADLTALNGATLDGALHPGDMLCAPAGAAAGASREGAERSDGAAAGDSYTIRSGDSWYGIADRADVAPGALLGVNDASVSTALHPGQVIRLPAGATMQAAPAAWLEVSPVVGRCWTADTWLQGRPDGRQHRGVDLIAATGTPIRAVVDGVLVRWQWDQPGLRAGHAWYLATDDGTTYFYAHMSGFAAGLGPGSRVAAGDVIGYVGSTGNSTTPHLHFEIRPRGGAPINPYPHVAPIAGCGHATTG